jgi:hypothetical protein
MRRKIYPGISEAESVVNDTIAAYIYLGLGSRGS